MKKKILLGLTETEKPCKITCQMTLFINCQLRVINSFKILTSFPHIRISSPRFGFKFYKTIHGKPIGIKTPIKVFFFNSGLYDNQTVRSIYHIDYVF